MSRATALDPSPRVSDEIRKTTCYMCACRCGIDVHMRGGRVSTSRATATTRSTAACSAPRARPASCSTSPPPACARRSAAPARAARASSRRSPGTRPSASPPTGSRRSATSTPRSSPSSPAATSRQSFTGWWAQQFGTPNYAAHGGFCSVNMAAAGIYTLGGAFWEFGAPDWERTELLLLFGVAEDHDCNPIKIGLGKLKARGARIVSVNPVRTGYSAIADQWIGITPGTDGLLDPQPRPRADGRGQDRPRLPARATPTPPTSSTRTRARPASAASCATPTAASSSGTATRHKRRALGHARRCKPALTGTFNVGPTHAKPVFQLMADAYLDPALAPEAVAPACGLDPGDIRRLAAVLARTSPSSEAITLDRPWTDFRGERHETMTGRPVAFHAMRGISAHANGFQTCRALHLLQLLLGAVETPGGFRFKPPYPKPVAAHPQPAPQGHPRQAARRPAPRLPARPRGPRHRRRRPPEAHRQGLLLGGAARRPRHDAHGHRQRRGRRPLPDRGALPLHGQHGLELGDEHRRDHGDADRHRRRRRVPASRRSSSPTPIPPRWSPSPTSCCPTPPTSSATTASACSTARSPSPTPPPTPSAGRWSSRPTATSAPSSRCCSTSAHRLRPPRHGRARRHARPTRDYADYMIRHQRRPGVGPLAGWRGDGSAEGRGAPNPASSTATSRTAASGPAHVPEEAAYFKPWNAAYQDWAVRHGLLRRARSPTSSSSTPSRSPASRPPPSARATASRPSTCATASPAPWRRCRSGTRPPADAGIDPEAFPLHAITQRPAAMYHSWGSQNAWLRQIHGENPLYVPGPVWEALGFEPGDWADVVSPHARITVPVARMDAQNPLHRLDLERHRQAPRRLGARPRRARGHPRLPAQPPDPRAPAAGPTAALAELRPGHRPGRLVRPPRPPRARPRPRPQRPRLPAPGLAGRPRTRLVAFGAGWPMTELGRRRPPQREPLAAVDQHDRQRDQRPERHRDPLLLDLVGPS